MKALLYLVTGILFGYGLSISGMIDPLVVKGFLSIGFSDWNPALVFVLGSAVPTYFILFLWIKKRKKTVMAKTFENPQPKPIDRKLLLGASMFGIGWGIAGVCPGPALVHLAFIDFQFTLFLIAMFLGFELQRRLV